MPQCSYPPQFQAFTNEKIQNAGVPLGLQPTSLLTWSLGPALAKPAYMASIDRVQTFNNLDTAVNANLYNGSHLRLIKAVSPNCSDLILECQLGNRVLDGPQCCSQMFDPEPVYNQYGTLVTG